MQRPRSLRDTASRNGDRAASEVIGFVLIFGILIISWSIYQGFEVPLQNERAEFNHNQRAQQDLLDLRDGILRTGVTDVQQTITITVGADYPRRTIAVNFGAPGGTVKTRDPAPNDDNRLYLRNIAALDAETRDYLNGSLNVTTKSIVFVPSYTWYADAPETVIAGGAGAVFNEFDETNLSIGNQLLISDRTITVVAIDGNLSKSRFREGATVSVETKPLSVATNTVTIENNQSGRINITIPTQIDDVTTWNESGLESQFGDDGPIDEIKRPSANHISILLKDDQYTLRMLKVGVGTGTTQPDGKYLTDIQTPAGTVSENSSNKIILEVRDAFNNPVDGFQVNGSIYSSAAAENGTLSVVGERDSVTNATKNANQDYRVTTNSSDGRVIFNYTAPDVGNASMIKLNFTIRSAAKSYEEVWVNTTVLANGANDS